MKPGVLLLHGFTSHRSSLEALVPALEQRGLDWRFPILAGHGTRPEDLKKRRWADWLRDAESAFQELRGKHDRVVIVALSMGALLAMELAHRHPSSVAGLVLIAPCLRFRNPMAKFTPIIGRVLRSYPNPSKDKFSDPKLARLDRGYQRFPTDAYRSFWERTRTIRTILGKLECPVRIIHSRVDRVADPRGAIEIYESLRGPKELLWHERSGHEMLLDVEKGSVLEEVLSFPQLSE